MKKGFTLIELLAVIAILAIVLLVAVPSIINIINNVKNDAFVKDEQMMVSATKTYLAANQSLLPANVGDTVKIDISTLITNNFISSIKDIYDGSNCTGYVLVKKIDINYNYIPYLSCGTNYVSDEYPSDGLLIQYDGFDAPSNISGTYYWLDRSSYHNNGTLYNMALTPTSGYNHTTKSYVFDGNDDYINSMSILPNLTDYTYEIIYKAYDYRYSQISAGWADLKWRVSTQNPYWNFWDTLNNYTTTGYTLRPDLNTINSYVYTFDGTNLNLYYNNTLNSTRAISGRTAHTSTILSLGVGTEKLYGELYSVRIYNRVLNSDELTHNNTLDKKRFNF